MAKSCVFVPSKGKGLHKKLRDQFGYELGTQVFLKGIHPQFIADHKNSLTLDSEGVPSFESLIKVPYIKNFIGTGRMRVSLDKKFPPVENTLDNYRSLLSQALEFNTQGSYKDTYVATVDTTKDGKIKVVVNDKTEESVNRFNNQYSAYSLNQRLASIFSPLGVNIGMLTKAEEGAGRVGITDFNNAKAIANEFISLIKVANNIEGEGALSEEYSHLIIGIFRKEPLVRRSIAVLENNPDAIRQILEDEYDRYVNFHEGNMSLVAEEALGHVLKDNLLKENIGRDVPNRSLFSRLINFIRRQFSRFSADDVQRAIIETDRSMNNLAKNILSQTIEISKEDIESSSRDVRFNALSDIIDTNIEILKEAAKTEVKRARIAGTNNASSSLVSELLKFANPNEDTAYGILTYARSALTELKQLKVGFSGFDSLEQSQKFGFLRAVKMYIDSYGQFIEKISDNITQADDEGESIFTSVSTPSGEVDITEPIRELRELSRELARRFIKVAIPTFAEYLKPVIGERFNIKGREYTVEDLLREAPEDISLFDRWLDSMADSSDIILQGFDAIYKKAVDNTRLNAIEAIQEIQRFQEKVEGMGITDFEWMFEKTDDGRKTGNYIQEINFGQFEKDREDLETRLDEKYGKNPRGNEALAKIAERNSWYEENAVSVFGTAYPKSEKYKNSTYASLSDRQRQVLNEFLQLKEKYDAKFPESRVAKSKAIQMRKRGSSRLWQSITNPSTIVTNIKESIKDDFLEREDDDTLFGDSRIARSLTNFDGSEFMSIPVLYTTRLKNPDDLETDVFGTLITYAYSALEYEQLDSIVNPLEVGRSIMKNRDTRKTRGNKQLIEKVKGLGVEAVNKVFSESSNVMDKLNDFFESKIYHRYLKDEGTWEILGQEVNKNKLVSWILSKSSVAQLGFNFLANLANVTTGVAMQNIEAASREYFTPSALLKADWEYKNHIIGSTADMSRRIKLDKLTLFDELFDIRQNYSKNVKRRQDSNIIKRLFGAEFHFIGQEAGDHWLYNRTAIAMAMEKQVLFNGRKTSLWDALQVRKKYEDSEVRELNVDEITELDGSPLDIHKFGERVKKVNQSLFGIYNEDDANAASRVAVGRLLQQYRKWMKAQYNKRFMANQRDAILEQDIEGYYRTVGNILNQMIRGHVTYSQIKDNLTDHQKANVRRCITEIAQFFAIWVLANLVEWPDDKDRPWVTKLAEYSAKRLAHETGNLTPIAMPRELFSTLSNPVPSSSVLLKLYHLVGSAIDPRDWNNEIQSGPYKGMSTLHKRIMQAPLPVLNEYRQMDRFIDDIDTSIDFYVRNTQ